MKFSVKRTYTYLLIGVSALLIVSLTGSISSWFSGPQISYNRDIRPIINQKCIACHGGVKQSGGFSLLFREDALGPTDSGEPAIIPGKAHKSELYRRLTATDPEERMPLDHEPLPESEIKLIKQWINEGAHWENHWAYVIPDEDLSPPTVADVSWPINGIDKFVRNQLETAELSPSPIASKAQLIRRLSLDLIGLPPTQEEAAAFIADTSSQAYEAAVDRLLVNPAFGEKWASMWLDLARYADSKGYEKDLNRSIWKYRDWVINAFNADMPFDQFTLEQLAGDMLEDANENQLIATAFHRNTMANDEGGTNDEEFRIAAAVERVGTTWEVWQGTTMACVQCHSHPYDPFRHEDFYRFMSYFNNTADKDIYNEQPKLFTYEDSQRVEVEAILSWVQDQTNKDWQPDIDTFLYENRNQLLYDMDYRRVEAEEYQDHSRFIELTSPDQLSVFQIQDSSWIMFENIDLTDVAAIQYRYATPHSGGFVEVYLDSLKGQKISSLELKTTGSWKNWKTVSASLPPTSGAHDVYYYFRMNRDFVTDLFRLDWFQYQMAEPRYQAYGPAMKRQLASLYDIPAIHTPIMRELPATKRRTNRMFERGSWLIPGKEVSEGIPGSLAPLYSKSVFNRLEMAQWLISPENPLTARVAVNRFWEQIFGTGIVKTVEDLGTQGDAPSHPELLDWLAVRFRSNHKWRIKSLLKEIVMSATYRQQSHATEELLEKDPENRLLARGPRIRLAAEQIRDQALAATQLLDTSQLGPPVKLEQPDSRARDAYRQGDLIAYSPMRRAVYNYWRRIYPSAMMMTFDGSARSICTSRRIRTNTPLQALVLLNDSIYFKAAQALALHMDSTGGEVQDAIIAGYQQLMYTHPHPEKLDAFMELYDTAESHFCEETADMEETIPIAYRQRATPRLAALTLTANAMLNMDAWITKD